MEWIVLAWKYRNEIAIGLIISFLIGAGVYIKKVFNERDTLRTEVDILNAKVEDQGKKLKLNGDIYDAIQKIRITSNNNITAIVKESKPIVPDTGAILIPSGVQTSVYGNYSTLDTTPASK